MTLAHFSALLPHRLLTSLSLVFFIIYSHNHTSISFHPLSAITLSFSSPHRTFRARNKGVQKKCNKPTTLRSTSKGSALFTRASHILLFQDPSTLSISLILTVTPIPTLKRTLFSGNISSRFLTRPSLSGIRPRCSPLWEERVTKCKCVWKALWPPIFDFWQHSEMLLSYAYHAKWSFKNAFVWFFWILW